MMTGRLCEWVKAIVDTDEAKVGQRRTISQDGLSGKLAAVPAGAPNRFWLLARVVKEKRQDRLWHAPSL